MLFELGPVTIYTYGVLVAAGALIWLWYARRQARRAGLDAHRVWDLGIYTVLAALVVAKLWLLLSDWKYYAANPGDVLSLATLESGGTFYGGVLGAVLAIAVYAYTHTLPVLPILDSFAAALPLSHAIGRLGCFAAGCCYGKPTTLPWGVRFTDEAAARLAGTPARRGLCIQRSSMRSCGGVPEFSVPGLAGHEGTLQGTNARHVYDPLRNGARCDRILPRRSRQDVDVRGRGLADAGCERRAGLHAEPSFGPGGVRRMGSSHPASPAPAVAGPRAT